MKNKTPQNKNQLEDISKLMNKELVVVEQLFNRCFSQHRTCESACAYFNGLISIVERKNSWQIAEQAGYENPYSFQYLLGRALWDGNQLNELLAVYTIEHLGFKNSILSIDETGFLKKGQKSAGVGRQYSGTAGRIENCQIGVFLSYSTTAGRALIDRDLYIPQDWFKDKKRSFDAGIPETVEFKTKPQLALEMLKRTFKNITKPEWVVGDEVYSCYSLRIWLEKHLQKYALAIASNYPVHVGLKQYQARDFLKIIEEDEWKSISAGEGTKGQRYYMWSRRKINSDSPDGWERSIILRKNIKDQSDVSFYIVFTSDNITLESIVTAIGSRWTIEECFEMAKGEVGLDQYEVRSWTGWYRHITISMFALSFLTKLRHKLNQKEFEEHKKKSHKRSRMKKFLKSRRLI
jgi:SRSO17 transposase